MEAEGGRRRAARGRGEEAQGAHEAEARKPTREWSRQCVVREVQKATHDAALAARFANVDGARLHAATAGDEDDDPLGALLDEIELSGLAPRKAARAALEPFLAKLRARDDALARERQRAAEAKREAEERAQREAARRRKAEADAAERKRKEEADAADRAHARARRRGAPNRRRRDGLRRSGTSRRARPSPSPSGTRRNSRRSVASFLSWQRRRPRRSQDSLKRRR